MDHLMKRIERDGRDVARQFVIARSRKEDIGYLRGELAGLARATWYVTGEDIDAVEKRWLAEASHDRAREELKKATPGVTLAEATASFRRLADVVRKYNSGEVAAAREP